MATDLLISGLNAGYFLAHPKSKPAKSSKSNNANNNYNNTDY